MSTEDKSPGTAARGDIFATTRWTVVLAAGDRSSPAADVALEELCRTYWYPLYAYVRRQGHAREDAEDLTQAFFARLLEKNYLEGLDSNRGRFRAFLLAASNIFWPMNGTAPAARNAAAAWPRSPSTGRTPTPAIRLNRPTT